MRPKQLLYAAIFVLLHSTASSQSIIFKDLQFKNNLIETGVDLNGDGQIQQNEAEQVDSLFIMDLELTDLEGIQYFKNIEFLDCSDNLLENIDLTENKKLKRLRCENNELSILNIEDLTGLKVLDCSYNNLDYDFYSSLSALQFFDCNNNNFSSEIIVSNQNLIYLDMSFNPSTALKVNALTNLLELHCTNMRLSTIDVSMNTQLNVLNAASNAFYDIDVSNNPEIVRLDVIFNRLLEVDVSTNLKLVILRLNNNNLKEIDLSHLSELKQFACQSNLITELDVTNNENLTLLNCRDNRLSSLDVTNLNELKFLDIIQNDISTLDIFNLEKIESLYVSKNRLKTLAVSQKPKLKILECEDNALTLLDLSASIEINSINCNLNSIKNLILPASDSLRKLSCNTNSISEFTFSNFDSLEYLNIGNNKFEELILGFKPIIREVISGRNQIKKFEIEGADSLTYINIEQNPIIDLSLNHCPKLINLQCSNSGILYLDILECPELQTLDCKYSPLKLLDLTGNPNINFIELGSQLKYLNLSNDTSSKELNIRLINTNFYKSQFEALCADEDEVDKIIEELQNSNLEPTQYLILKDCAFPELAGSLDSELKGTSLFALNEECDEEAIKLNNLILNVKDKYSPFLKFYPAFYEQNYVLKVPEGSYQLEPEFNIQFPTEITPTLFQVDLSNSTISTQDICTKPSGKLAAQLEAQIIPLNEARPGFTLNYKILYRNIGNLRADGVLDFYFDNSILNYIQSSPELESTGGKLSLEFEDLKPFEQREITLRLKLNSPQDTPPVNNRDKLTYFVRINEVREGLTNQAVNFYKSPPDLCQNVVNSHDPNDKTLLQGPFLLDSLLGNYVDYLVRFENTGTASAIDVVIEDKIDPLIFDINTIRVVDASHPVSQTVKRNNVSFTFENINLPFDDDNNDGYVLFKIKTLDDLEIGDLLKNTARIFFDFNFPIITNTSVSELVTDFDEDGFHNAIDCDDNDDKINPLAIDISGNNIDEDCDGFDSKPVLVDGANVNIYPNPVTHYLSIKPLDSAINYSVTLYDMSGLKLWSGTRSTVIDMSYYSAGTYWVYIDDLNSGRRKIEKIIVLR